MNKEELKKKLSDDIKSIIEFIETETGLEKKFKENVINDNVELIKARLIEYNHKKGAE